MDSWRSRLLGSADRTGGGISACGDGTGDRATSVAMEGVAFVGPILFRGDPFDSSGYFRHRSRQSGDSTAHGAFLACKIVTGYLA
jgi:hypothetical protein